MKNLKRLLAVLGIIVLAGMYVLSFILSLTDHSQAGNMLMASLFATVMVPILLYAFLLVHKWTHPKDELIPPIVPDSEKVDTLIFDLDKVLIRFNWKKLFSSLKYDEETSQIIANATFLSPEWQNSEQGTLTEEELLQAFINHNPAYEQEIRKVFQEMGKAVSICSYTKEWITYFKKRGYKLYVLANFSEPLYNRCQKELKFLDLMDGGYMSWQIHCLKPEPEIFQKLIEDFHIDPSKAVFLDDVIDNVAEARAQGLHAIHFTGRKQAMKQLLEFGVK